MLKKFFFIIVFLALISGYLPAQVDSIRFGKGGGFSGNVTTNRIIGHCLYIQNHQGILPKAYHLKRKEYKTIFNAAKKVFSESYEMDHPYNTYQFLEIYTNNGSKKLVWGDPAFEIPKDLQTFFNDLIKLTISQNK